jgi:hypothetical protein
MSANNRLAIKHRVDVGEWNKIWMDRSKNN